MRNNDAQLLREQTHSSAGFLPGLVFGAFAGIAGMFLFSTKKGQKTLEHMKKTWKKVEPQVEKELETAGQKLDKSGKPVLQALGEIVQYVAEGLGKTTKKKK
jgi:gas vesicle protein